MLWWLATPVATAERRQQTASAGATLARAIPPAAPGSGPLAHHIPKPVVGQHKLTKIPTFNKVLQGRFVTASPRGDALYVLTPLLELQGYLEELVAEVKAPHIAMVALQPHSGRILALAGKSKTISGHVATHADFPAASLFKIITAAAALYDSKITPNSIIRFRGGNYTLNKYNYRPSTTHDKRTMTVAKAMGKSCNPVFGRLALGLRTPALLRDLALLFRFGLDLYSDFPLPRSRVYIPSDSYELARTGAGFGKVTISAVHAAAIMATLGNQGKFPTPHLIHQVISTKTSARHLTAPPPKPIIEPSVAQQLLTMMESTITEGTAKPAFIGKHGKRLLPFRVAGKTGTLRGKDPKGLTKWFIAAAPLPNPRIAVAIVVVNPRYLRDRPTFLGKQVLQRFLS